MNNFLMFIGVPCQGKTTLIEKNQQAITSVYGVDSVVSSDSVIEDVATARGLTYTEVFKDSIQLAGKYIEAMVGILSLQQRNFILDQTNLTVKSRKQKLGLLVHPQNYNKIAVVFDDVKEPELTDRHNTRAATGKIIPPEVLQNMSKAFTFPTHEEGFTKIMTVKEFLESLKDTTTKYGEMAFG